MIGLHELRPAPGAKHAAKRVERKGVSQSARNIGIFRKDYAIANVGQFEVFEAGTVVTSQLLLAQRIIRDPHEGLRILGDGELTKALTVRAKHFTASALAKIQAAGGTAEVI
jgi:large subunit ribosomal protein L15